MRGHVLAAASSAAVLVGALACERPRSGGAPRAESARVAPGPGTSTDAGCAAGVRVDLEAGAPSRGACADLDAGSRAVGPDAGCATRAHVYLAGWSMDTPVAWSRDATLVLFSLLPTRAGEAEPQSNRLLPDRIAPQLRAARAAGARIHVAVGGANTGPTFREAIETDAGASLARSLSGFARRHGLDGVVLDIEPLEAVSPAALASFARALVEATRGAPRPLEIGAVVSPDPREIARLAPIAEHLSHLGVMSYLGAHDRDDAALAATDAIGVPRHRVALGVDALTPKPVAARRAAGAGGVILWEAGRLCRDLPAPCDPLAMFRSVLACK